MGLLGVRLATVLIQQAFSCASGRRVCCYYFADCRRFPRHTDIENKNSKSNVWITVRGVQIVRRSQTCEFPYCVARGEWEQLRGKAEEIWKLET